MHPRPQDKQHPFRAVHRIIALIAGGAIAVASAHLLLLETDPPPTVTLDDSRIVHYMSPPDRGGGASPDDGEGTIGLGSLTTIGHGGGGGSISGTGRGGGGVGYGSIGIGGTGAGYGMAAGMSGTYHGGLTGRFAPYANTESYASTTHNPFHLVQDTPLSTFSIDVDTASFANIRRFIDASTLPPQDAVRIEEMVNYFTWSDPAPESDEVFAVRTETSTCPWNNKHLLTRVGLRARGISDADRPPANLVFLVDVSGSMMPDEKLPLLRQALKRMVHRLNSRDRIALVVYAGASGLVLDSTSCRHRDRITAAIDQLCSGGSTNGAEGIELAYEVARRHFIKGGINRVILATDGDFNVGVTSHGDLIRLMQEKKELGIFITVLGVGMGNYKDDTLEYLADRGNGNYAYIDGMHEAQKVLIDNLTGTLLAVAKDVKIQVEFNPAEVSSYRLLGYENRLLEAKDFKDDKKDAGEAGAGHGVTALYELVPTRGEATDAGIDPLRYQTGRMFSPDAAGGELFTLKLRYKPVDSDTSVLREFRVPATVTPPEQTSADFRFAASVAGFGMLLRKDAHTGRLTLEDVLALGTAGKGADKEGYRSGFLRLVESVRHITADDPHLSSR